MNDKYNEKEVLKEQKQTIFVILFILSIIAALALMTGCAYETVAKGITAKNVSGNGTVINSHIGLNPDTKIPEQETVFISGDFATVKAGTNSVCYREESSTSVWNASSITRKRFLSITLTDKGDLPAVIRAVAEVISNSEKTASATPADANAAEQKPETVEPEQQTHLSPVDKPK